MDTYIQNRWPTDTHSVPRCLSSARRKSPNTFRLQRKRERGMEAFLWKGQFPSSRYIFTMSYPNNYAQHKANQQSPVSDPVKRDITSKSVHVKKRKRKSLSPPPKDRPKQPRHRKKKVGCTKKRISSSRSYTFSKQRKQRVQKCKRNKTKLGHPINPVRVRRPHNWRSCSSKLSRKINWKLCVDLTCRPSRHQDPCPPPKPPCPPDPEPPCDCLCGTQTIFQEEKFMQLTIHQESVLPAQDTSVASVISYAIHNHSSVPLITELEISPNGIDYAKDSTLTIEPQTMKVAVPLRFLRWMRLRLYTTEGESGTADVYYQAQSLGCQEEEQ